MLLHLARTRARTQVRYCGNLNEISVIWLYSPHEAAQDIPGVAKEVKKLGLLAKGKPGGKSGGKELLYSFHEQEDFGLSSILGREPVAFLPPGKEPPQGFDGLVVRHVLDIGNKRVRPFDPVAFAEPADLERAQAGSGRRAFDYPSLVVLESLSRLPLSTYSYSYR